MTKYQDLLTSSHFNVTSWLKLPLKAMATGSSSKLIAIFAEVTREVLNIPLSSSPVERLFSIAGKVFTSEHCRLTDARFQELMLIIRCNN